MNTWSYLVLKASAYAASVTWTETHLSASGHGFSGVSFCTGDRSGVWFEGTAHLADALELRGRPGDRAKARAYLRDIEHAQVAGPNSDGRGIIAASKNGLRTCDGDLYYASLHTGSDSLVFAGPAVSRPFSPHSLMAPRQKSVSFSRRRGLIPLRMMSWEEPGR